MANVSVAAVATFCSQNPMRASSTTGSDSQCPIVRPTVCRPRWWLSSWASTPASSRRRQLVEGERRDDDEVAAAGEGVELVARQHAQDVAVGRQVVGAGDVAPQRARGGRARRSVGRRAPNSGVSTSAWIGRTNSSTAAERVAAGEPPERRRPTRAARAARSTNSASRQNGAMTSTGPIAATADASSWRLRRRGGTGRRYGPVARRRRFSELSALGAPSAASEIGSRRRRARPRRRRTRRARRRAGRCARRARRG